MREIYIYHYAPGFRMAKLRSFELKKVLKENSFPCFDILR